MQEEGKYFSFLHAFARRGFELSGSFSPSKGCDFLRDLCLSMTEW